jgi:hypothetical protein
MHRAATPVVVIMLAAALAPLGAAAARAGNTTGQIRLAGIIAPSLDARAVSPSANGDALVIGCNFATALRVSVESRRWKTPADAQPRYVATWRSPAPQAFACRAPGEQVVVPLARPAPGESLTTTISIN